jgi:hypothetical protein
MNDRGDSNDILVKSIDDSVAVSEPFTDLFVIEFRHDATGKGNCENLRVISTIVFATDFGVGG